MKLSLPLAIAALTWRIDARCLVDSRGADPARPSQTQDPGLQDIDIYDHLSAPASMTTSPPSRAAVELRLRQDSSAASLSSNTWLNPTICGWYSGSSSRPYTCGTLLTCATNTENAVNCVTPGAERFPTICLNYEAVQSSKCTAAGPKTVCCSSADLPACGTFLWSGSPTRSMYKCSTTPTVVAMIDEPQFVVDASISSASVAAFSSAAAAASRSSASIASASSAAAASASSSSAFAAAASRASELGGSSVTITMSTAGLLTTFTAVAGATGTVSGVTLISSVLYTTTGSDGASTTYTAIGADISGLDGSNGGNGGNGSNGSNGGSGGSGSTNVGAIAGGVVGGVMGLLLLLLLLWYLKKKNKGLKFSFKLCGGNKKVNKTDNREYKDKRQYDNRDNREYDTRDNREYDNRKTSGDGSGKGGFSLFGAKSKSTKEELTTTNNHYYGDEVRNDNRSYDKRKFKDNRGFEDKRKYNSDSESPSVTPSQTQNFRSETGARASHGRSPSFDSRDENILGIAAFGGRGSSNREQRKQGRSSRTKHYIPDSRSPSPAQLSPTHEAAMAAGTSRRDKRRQERRQARGERTPSPERQVAPEREYSEDEDAQRASGRPGKWQLPAQIIANAHKDSSGQPQNVHVHVHIHENELDRGSRRGRSRQSQERSRASSRRAPHYDEDEEALDEEERQQELERGRQGSRTHQYHPGSGRRNVPVASPNPSHPSSMAQPPDDFLGKAL